MTSSPLAPREDQPGAVLSEESIKMFDANWAAKHPAIPLAEREGDLQASSDGDE